MRHADSTATGQKAVESTTMTLRHSLCGSMKKTSSALSLCKMERTLEQCFQDLPVLAPLLKKSLNLPTLKISVTLLAARQTSEQLCAPPFTSTCPTSDSNQAFSKPSLTSTTCKFAASTVSTLRQLITSTISAISVALDFLKKISFKICTTALKL